MASWSVKTLLKLASFKTLVDDLVYVFRFLFTLFISLMQIVKYFLRNSSRVFWVIWVVWHVHLLLSLLMRSLRLFNGSLSFSPICLARFFGRIKLKCIKRTVYDIQWSVFLRKLECAAFITLTSVCLAFFVFHCMQFSPTIVASL